MSFKHDSAEASADWAQDAHRFADEMRCCFGARAREVACAQMRLAGEIDGQASEGWHAILRALGG